MVWPEEPSKASYILKNVSCDARPGEITTIAGPSGAGKTTLLEILAGMIPLNNIVGQVLVNEQPMNAQYFRRISGYVTQDEALFLLLTVKETLMYSARLRLRGELETATSKVEKLLDELGLEHIANVRVGSKSNRGISGGEKRKVSIGVDLVHDPVVLLLDEPTSWLDSASALDVALLLKSMAAEQGKTIVLTIHQPGFRILELFNQILLLSNGTLLHRGSLHLLKQRLKYVGHFIPKHANLLKFAMDATKDLIGMEEIKEEYEYIRAGLATCRVEGNKFCFPNPRLKEIYILGQRVTSNIYRTKQLFVARTIQALLAAFVLGTSFMNAAKDPRGATLQTLMGFFAFSLAFLLSCTTEGLPIYLRERRMLMRETSRGAYRVSSYVISNTLVFLPFL
ncbi:hypothetical protein ACE6H2_010725 [Prunus campanulata]